MYLFTLKQISYTNIYIIKQPEKKIEHGRFEFKNKGNIFSKGEHDGLSLYKVTTISTN